MTFGRALFLTTAATCALMLGAIAAGMRLNVTPSMPIGIYRQVPPTTHRGELVIACLDPRNPAVADALHRGYLPVGDCPGGVAPVIKRIAAVSGDHVQPSPLGLRINGRLVLDTAALSSDPAGKPLIQVEPAPYTIPPGHVLLLAPGRGSFDGRYFGAISADAIRAGAKPLLTTTH